MFTFTLRRLAFAVPTLLVISFVIFALLDLAPNDPTGDLPLTIPPEVREQIRASLGLDQPFFIRYLMWLQQFFINEPLNLIERLTGWQIGDGSRMRVLSWATRSPVVDLVIQRMPQTLWVVGLAYLFGALLAIPIGVISAYKQYSIFDQIGTFVSMVGYSVPTFFTGVLLVVIFRLLPAMVPFRLRHQPSGDRLGKFRGAGEADVPAGSGADALQCLTDQPLRARLDAGQSASGLRAHRTRQGREGKIRSAHPCAAQ